MQTAELHCTSSPVPPFLHILCPCSRCILCITYALKCKHTLSTAMHIVAMSCIHPNNWISWLENSAENSNFPQKDCLGTRKLSILKCVRKKVNRHIRRPKCVEKSCRTCSWFQILHATWEWGGTHNKWLYVLGSLWHNAVKRRMHFFCKRNIKFICNSNRLRKSKAQVAI